MSISYRLSPMAKGTAMGYNRGTAARIRKRGRWQSQAKPSEAWSEHRIASHRRDEHITTHITDHSTAEQWYDMMPDWLMCCKFLLSRLTWSILQCNLLRRRRLPCHTLLVSLRMAPLELRAWSFNRGAAAGREDFPGSFAAIGSGSHEFIRLQNGELSGRVWLGLECFCFGVCVEVWEWFWRVLGEMGFGGMCNWFCGGRIGWVFWGLDDDDDDDGGGIGYVGWVAIQVTLLLIAWYHESECKEGN